MLRVDSAPEVDLSSFPDLDLNEEWGKLVRQARIKRSLTQAQLADAIGISQAMVNYIEAGSVQHSRAVFPLATLLDIALPEIDARHFATDLERRWWNAGRLLRAQNETTFRAFLDVVERLVQPPPSED
jgi:transcriptional regulator with XRE-family HTH domain